MKRPHCGASVNASVGVWHQPGFLPHQPRDVSGIGVFCSAGVGDEACGGDADDDEAEEDADQWQHRRVVGPLDLPPVVGDDKEAERRVEIAPERGSRHQSPSASVAHRDLHGEGPAQPVLTRW